MIKKIIVGLVFLGLITLGLLLAPQMNKRFDRNLRYIPDSYKPYDTRFFYESLKKYAGKGFKVNHTAPSPKNLKGENSLYVICSPNFLPNEAEKREIFKFVSAGNHLLLSTFSISSHALNGLSDILYFDTLHQKPLRAMHDSLSIEWHNGLIRSYPGSAHQSSIYLDEQDSTQVPFSLAINLANQQSSLVMFTYGRGKIFIQLQPTVFTNYFLLHKNNSDLLTPLFEDLDIKNRYVIWDDFYIQLKNASRPRSNSSSPPKGESFFIKMMMEHPPLLWAVLTFVITAVLFIFNHARRVRKPVPKLPEMQDTSLAFTNAIAELYWQRKDHSVIAHKIQLQWQNYLYTHFKIFPKDITEQNLEAIATKSGKTQEEIAEILKFGKETKFSEKNLIDFYRLVYKFIYK
jgi:hypothetical protein